MTVQSWTPCLFATLLRGAGAAAAILASLSSVGCAGDVGDLGDLGDEPIGEAAGAALQPNALQPNALQPNALQPNALQPNALQPNALQPNALQPNALSAIQASDENGALARELLRYTVGCAFRPDQSFSFSWTDAGGVTHNESYPGLIGLAPEWAAQPLGLTGQRWVSSCLASRVNAKGVSVMLSSRGAHPALATTASERSSYTTRESVFFGNLFTDAPQVYACYDPLNMVASQMADRVCAQPLAINTDDLSLGYDCGPIHVIGPCAGVSLLGVLSLSAGVCGRVAPIDQYFYDCSDPSGQTTSITMTNFLAGPIPW